LGNVSKTNTGTILWISIVVGHLSTYHTPSGGARLL